MRRVIAAAAAGAALLLAAGCSSSSSTTSSGATANSAASTAAVTVRLGFLTNITHASALVGLKEGFFTKDLGSAGTLQATAFSTGTEETTALLAGQLHSRLRRPKPGRQRLAEVKRQPRSRIISGAATAAPPSSSRRAWPPRLQLKGKTLRDSLARQHAAERRCVRRLGRRPDDRPRPAAAPGRTDRLPTRPQYWSSSPGRSPAVRATPYDVEMVKDGGTVPAQRDQRYHLACRDAAPWPRIPR